MLKVLKLLKREYLAAVKTKGFVIMLVVAPVMMSGSIIAIKLLEDKVDISDKRVVILDHTGEIADTLISKAEYRNSTEIFDLENGKQIKPAYLLERREPADTAAIAAQRLSLSDSIRSGELYAFLEIGSGVIHPSENRPAAQISYHSENSALDDLRRWLNWPINDQLRRLRLRDAEISVESAPDLFWWINAEGLGLISVDDSGEIQDAEESDEIQAILIPIFMTMLMFMMAMMGAIPQLNAIMEEKSQKIAEVLLGSISPIQFMLGKVLGGLAIALTGSTIYVSVGVLYVEYIGYGSYIPYDVLPWFFTFMILLIFMMGSIMVGLGSVCNDARDASNLTFPAMIPAMIPMFVLVPVLKEPMSGFSTGMSLFPPFIPMVMTLRLSSPQSIPAWQPWLGLIIVLLFTLFSVWAGSRLFRVGILMQGATINLRNLLKWTFRG